MTDQKLKEAAENHALNAELTIEELAILSPLDFSGKIRGLEKKAFIAGVQWQAEQMSDEVSKLQSQVKELQASLKSAVEELQKINKMVGACPFSNQDKWGDILESVWKISKNIPSQLKSKHPDMFKGEE